MLPAGLTFEDVNKVVDIIISEIANNDTNSKKFIILDNGYITTADYIQRLISESHNYLRNLSRTLKLKNRNYGLVTTIHDNDVKYNISIADLSLTFII
jgi:hypothetical protein